MLLIFILLCVGAFANFVGAFTASTRGAIIINSLVTVAYCYASYVAWGMF